MTLFVGHESSLRRRMLSSEGEHGAPIVQMKAIAIYLGVVPTSWLWRLHLNRWQ